MIHRINPVIVRHWDLPGVLERKVLHLLTGGEEGGGPTQVGDLAIVGDHLYYTITNQNSLTGLWRTTGDDNGAERVTGLQQSNQFAVPLTPPMPPYSE